MELEGEVGIWLAIFWISLLYASAGQGGASGYLAVMAFLDLAPDSMRATAFAMSILVAGMSFAFYAWGQPPPVRVLIWLLGGSIPGSILGASLHVPSLLYRVVLGGLLLLSAWKFFQKGREEHEDPVAGMNPSEPEQRPWVLILLGLGIGVLSGITGIGGGILLSPLLLFLRWKSVRQIASLTSFFILANSLAGLVVIWGVRGITPVEGWGIWMVVAGAGGILGAYAGSRWFPERVVSWILGGILLVAGIRLVWVW